MATVNLVSVIRESVEEGLTKAGLPDTAENRIDVLKHVYTELSKDSSISREVLNTISIEIIVLKDELAA